ncbi:MAG: hypothetical protein LC672_05575, partial [Acidobacteria bacterium]|nr:hypothetical protein [Acidobacteriota bacterium]
GSYGAVRVCEGMLWETTFGLNGSGEPFSQSARTWHAGQVVGSDVPDIHQLGNPDASRRNLVTLHLYAPPLGVINTYKLGSPFVERFSPTESEKGIIKDFVDPYMAHVEKI